MARYREIWGDMASTSVALYNRAPSSLAYAKSTKSSFE